MRCSLGFISLVALDARALGSNTQPNTNVELSSKSVHHDATAICNLHQPLERSLFWPSAVTCSSTAEKRAGDIGNRAGHQGSNVGNLRFPSDRRQEVAHKAAAYRGKEKFSAHGAHVAPAFIVACQ